MPVDRNQILQIIKKNYEEHFIFPIRRITSGNIFL